jgi:hypothetical protein
MYNTAEMLADPCVAPLRFCIFDALDHFYFALPSQYISGVTTSIFRDSAYLGQL